MSGSENWSQEESGWVCNASLLGWHPGQIPVQVQTPAGIVAREQWLPFSAHGCDAADREIIGWRCRLGLVTITVFNI